MTKVINIKDAPYGWQEDEQYVYIGRTGHGLDGYFGNPIQLKGKKRGATLELFRSYVVDRLETDEIYLERVKELKDKTLVCFCKPHPCHGDILAYYSEKLCQNNT